MAEERDQIACWTERTSVQGADLTPEEERAALRAFRAWERYRATGEPTDLVELGILPADGTVRSEPLDEPSPRLALRPRFTCTCEDCPAFSWSSFKHSVVPPSVRGSSHTSALGAQRGLGQETDLLLERPGGDSPIGRYRLHMSARGASPMRRLACWHDKDPRQAAKSTTG